MSDVERLIEKLSLVRGLVPLREVEKLLKQYGYERERTGGSHFHYRAPDMPNIGFPCHNNKVSAVYVRTVIRIIIGHGK